MLNNAKFALTCVAMLALSAALIVSAGSQAVYAEPQFDSGCYCHNNGIALWFNGTGYNEFSAVTVKAGGSFVLNATSSNWGGTGTVPGVQQWLSNESDTAKFTISPMTVQVNSPQNVSPVKINQTITALYKITAPTTSGTYSLALYAEGQVDTVAVIVQAGSSASSTASATATQTSSSPTQTSTAVSSISSVQTSSTVQTSSSTPASTTQTATTTAKTTTQSNIFKNFPGLNLITLYVLAGTALVIGIILGIGVAVKSKSTKPAA